jgi:hypothetical protein
MCRPRVGVANPLFSLWRALRLPTAPASRTKSRRTAEESRTRTKVTVCVSTGTLIPDPPFSSFGPSRDYGMDLSLEVYL